MPLCFSAVTEYLATDSEPLTSFSQLPGVSDCAGEINQTADPNGHFGTFSKNESAKDKTVDLPRCSPHGTDFPDQWHSSSTINSDCVRVFMKGLLDESALDTEKDVCE